MRGRKQSDYLDAAVSRMAGYQNGPGRRAVDGDGHLDAEPAPRRVARGGRRRSSGGHPFVRDFAGGAGAGGFEVVGVVPGAAEDAGDPAE
jgi:hypothetical protein